MSASIWPNEMNTTTDPMSGAQVTRLTNFRGHSCHLYFTENGFWDQDRQLLFTSDRLGTRNLFSVHLHSGEMVQLSNVPSGTDLDFAGSMDRSQQHYFAWLGRDMVSVDLRRATSEVIYSIPDGWESGLLGCGADGNSVWFALSQNLNTDRSVAYANYRQIAATPRLSRVVRLNLSTGIVSVLHEESAWITHVNPSPTNPELATFCHEGPWHLVQRMWVLDHGVVRALRPRDGLWGVGHEFWCADGETVGFHARRIGDDSRHLLGFLRADGTLVHEGETELPTQHAQANSPDLMVLDGTRATGDRLMLVRRTAKGWAPPRILCVHGTSRHHHFSHAHPRFSPDGRSVIYTSDRTGYSNVLRVTLPENLESLPLATAHPVERFYWM